MYSRPTLVAALATMLLVAGGCSDDAKPEPRATETSTATATELIRYDEVRIRNGAEVSKLEGSPEDFKAFISDLIEKAKADDDGSCDQPPEILVKAVHTSGFASGAVLQCGGYATIWATVAGQWREVWGGQELPSCDEMLRLGVPEGIPGDTCRDGEREVPYRP